MNKRDSEQRGEECKNKEMDIDMTDVYENSGCASDSVRVVHSNTKGADGSTETAECW
jgi:hypothetical protein